VQSNIVFTLTGKDKIGMVEEVTQLLLKHGGNVGTSRMARLGGEFAILMQVTMPSDKLASLEKDVEKLTARGYKVTMTQTKQTDVEERPGWSPYRIEVIGADQEGIVHEIARYLSGQGINIETMDTGTTLAPISGTVLFALTALVAVPPGLAGKNWQAELQTVADQLNVEINVSDAGQK
jgi:glycine cleavage system transcriptional repressor